MYRGKKSTFKSCYLIKYYLTLYIPKCECKKINLTQESYCLGDRTHHEETLYNPHLKIIRYYFNELTNYIN